MEIVWGEVNLTAGKTANFDINTGIELVAHSKEDRPPFQWQVLDVRTHKPVTRVRERWGFTPVPPGDYLVTDAWVEAKVTDGQIVTLTMPDVPERLARLTGRGLKTEKERDLAEYKNLEE